MIRLYAYTNLWPSLSTKFTKLSAKWSIAQSLSTASAPREIIFFFSGSQLISQSHVSAIRTVSLISHMSTMSKLVGSISFVSVPVMLVKCVSHEKKIIVPPVNVNHVIPLSTKKYYYYHNRRASTILSFQKKKIYWDQLTRTYPRIRKQNYNLPMGRICIWQHE